MEIAIYKLNYGKCNYYRYILRITIKSKEYELKVDQSDLEELRNALLSVAPLTAEELAEREVAELTLLRKTEDGG